MAKSTDPTDYAPSKPGHRNGDKVADTPQTDRPDRLPSRQEAAASATSAASASTGEADIRSAIVSAALELFYERGYEATGVQDIVDRANRTKGALYHYFRSKEDLLVEIHNEFMESLAERGRAILDEGHRPTDALRLVVEAMMHEVKDRRAQFTVAFLETRIDFERHPEARAAGEEWRGVVRTIIEDGRRTGEFRNDVDPEVALWATFGMCIWAAFHWFPTRSTLPVQSVSVMLTNLLSQGLAAR